MPKQAYILSVCQFGNEQGELYTAQNLQKAVSTKFKTGRSIARTDRKFISDSYKISMFMNACIALILQMIIMGLFVSFYNQKAYSQTSQVISQSTSYFVSIIKEQLLATLQEGIVYLSTLSKLLEGREYNDETLLTDAYEIAKVIQEAAYSTTNSLLSFELGFSNNCFLVYSFYPVNRTCDTIYYTNPQYYGVNNMFSWETDNETIPEGFPTTGGNMSDNIASINTTETFQSVLQQPGEIIFSEPLFGWFPDIERICMKVSYGFTNTPNLSYQGFLSVNIDLSQSHINFREMKTDQHTRFAITADDGIIIALSGHEQMIDKYQTQILTKTLNDLHDDIWSRITKDERFVKKQNFTTTLNIDNEDLDLIITIMPINISGKSWYAYSIYCICDTVERASNMSTRQILQYCIGVVIFSVLFFAISILSTKCMFIVQSRVPKEPNKAKEVHIEKNNLPAALNDMKHAIDLADAPAIQPELDNIMNEIAHSGEFYLLSPLPLKKYAFEKEDPKKNEITAFCDILDKTNHFNTKNGGRKLVSDITKEDINTIVTNLFQKCSSIFDLNQVLNYINGKLDFIENLSQDEFIYLGDSYLFLSQLIDNCITFSDDILFAILLSILVFHLLVIQRHQKKELMTRFFVLDEEKMKETLFLELNNFYAFLKEGQEEKWMLYSKTARKIASIIPLKYHLMVLSMTPSYIGLTKELIRQSTYVSLEIAKVIVIASTNSIFICNKTQTKELLDIIGGSEAKEITNCFKNEYIKSIKRALYDIFGTKNIKEVCYSN